MTTEITARDKLLLYVVGMLAFIFFFVQFMLTPALEASDEAAASLAEAQQAQIAMQETIALAGTNAAAKTESWAALQHANANAGYHGSVRGRHRRAGRIFQPLDADPFL